MPTNKRQTEPITVRLVWDSSEHLETVYVNHAAILRSGPEYYLIFGEMAAPLVADIKTAPKELHIVPRVRLAISPEQMKAIADVIHRSANSDSEKTDDK